MIKVTIDVDIGEGFKTTYSSTNEDGSTDLDMTSMFAYALRSLSHMIRHEKKGRAVDNFVRMIEEEDP